jgi:hypothetical protein
MDLEINNQMNKLLVAENIHVRNYPFAGQVE